MYVPRLPSQSASNVGGLVIKLARQYIVMTRNNLFTFQFSHIWIWLPLFHVKYRLFKNCELYWSNLPQNSNLGRESFVQKSGAQIPEGAGQIFCYFVFFTFLNPTFLNKFPPKIWILMKIRLIEPMVLKKTWLYSSLKKVSKNIRIFG